MELPHLHERSDQDIAEAALRSLLWHVQVPHTRIRVKVEKGIITLEGDVDYRYQEIGAQDAVRDLTGVKAVVSLVNVNPRVTPLQVRTKIENALRRAAEVDVHHDKVVLRGTVRSWAERSEAERAAWAAAGVRTVENDLTVAA